jgi:hypothetical protein
MKTTARLDAVAAEHTKFRPFVMRSVYRRPIGKIEQASKVVDAASD